MNRSVFFVLMGIIFLLLFLGCKDKKIEKISESLHENSKSISVQDKFQEIKPIIPTDKQILYALHLDAITRYEVYVDDIQVDFNYEEDVSSTTVLLNDYLLENGLHRIKIIFYPLLEREDGILYPSDITTNDEGWNAYFAPLKVDQSTDLGYVDNIDYEKSRLPILTPSSPVEVWEQEFEVIVDQLPYTLEGWKNSIDLRTLDKEKLERDLVEFYENIRILINEGNIDEFQHLYKRCLSETYYVNFSTQPIDRLIKNSYLDFEKNWVGNMEPIENYEVRFYAEGRLVALKVKDGGYSDWPILISNGEEEFEKGLNLILHLPKGAKNFEIIRN